MLSVNDSVYMCHSEKDILLLKDDVQNYISNVSLFYHFLHFRLFLKNAEFMKAPILWKFNIFLHLVLNLWGNLNYSNEKERCI